MNYVKPIIERFGEDILINEDRKDAADKICNYLTDRDPIYLREYYESAASLLRQRDSERILLYLPFDELAKAPKNFKDAYMDAWWHLTSVYDVRENFHEGDTFEVDARPNGEMERVVKCIHLTPWLIKAGYIDEAEIVAMFLEQADDILLQSFRDTFPYIRDHKLLSKTAIHALEISSHDVPLRKKYSPLYVSKKREEWLNERNKAPGKLLTPGAQLEGPFSPNIESICVNDILAHFKPDEIVLIGGSRLKGYGTVDSDIDVWPLNELKNNSKMYPGSPHAAHIFFNAIWAGGMSVKNIGDIVKDIISLYDDAKTRRLSLERIESDLLQYRLLHKGFSRVTGLKLFETSSYLDMDGDCPFYNDEYRRIATMLYAKYVLIPNSNPY